MKSILLVFQFSVFSTRECVRAGAAGACTRRSLGHHLLHPLILRLLVLCAPADFEAQRSLLYNRLHPQIIISNACPEYCNAKNSRREDAEMKLHKRPFKYYVKEVGGWDQKMAIFDDLQYCKSSKRWLCGSKKLKNMMT